MLATINDTKIYYTDRSGSGSSSIVLVHGFPFSSAMWDAQVRALEQITDLRIVTYDLRGHGDSAVGDGQYTIELMVDDLIALLDHLKVAKTILCGFSMGGYIALRAVERHADRFSALILCDTQSAADSNESRIKRANSIKLVKTEGVARFAEGFLKSVFSPQTFETKLEIVDAARRIILSNSQLGICGSLLAMAARTDSTESLSKVHVPSLILVGQNDKVTPSAAATIMRDRIANSEMHILEHAAHMSNLENAESFNQKIVEFIRSVSRPV